MRFDSWTVRARLTLSALLMLATLVLLPQHLERVLGASFCLSNNHTEVTEVTSPSDVVARGPEVMLFCFALIKPGTYECSVMSESHRVGQGVFGCDEKVVYSNQSGWVGDGFPLTVVEQSLETATRTKWNVSVNVDQFVRVWAKVAGVRKVAQTQVAKAFGLN